jgi:uncharacterized membrane protein
MNWRHAIWITSLCFATVVCTRPAPQASAPNSPVIDSLAANPVADIDVKLDSAASAKSNGCINCDLVSYESEVTAVATLPADRPVVRAVMYWINGCPGCHHILENVLPPIQEKFGEQFQLRLIEVVGIEDYEDLVRVAASLGVPKDQVFVPFMILGEQALIGLDQIQAELPGLIEEYLARGGLDWPAWLEFSAQEAATAEGASEQVFTGGVARAILFTTLDCRTCKGEVAVLLEPILEEFGDQFEYRAVDIRTSEQVEYIYELAASHGFDREQTDLPMIMIGDHVLMGDRIEVELGDLVGGYLAAGGIDYPVVPEPPGQATLSPTLKPSSIPTLLPEEAVVRPIEDENPDGFALAIAVMVAMAAALVYALVRLVLAWVRDGNLLPVPTWQAWVIPALALVGLGVAAYLAYVETQLVHAVCGPVGDCNAVQSSPFARLFGVIPVGLVGVTGYLAILGAWIWGRLGGGRSPGYAALMVTGMALIGTLFSFYLTYLEPFVIQAVCLWCLTSAIVITLLLLFSLRPAINTIRLKKLHGS